MCSNAPVDPTRTFLGHFGIESQGSSLNQLSTLLNRFSNLPYENLSKISGGRFEEPEELVHNHIEFGTGGTCFSLVNLFKVLLDTCGFESRFLLADRSYGTDTHCAIAVRIGGMEYLADPGYLLFTPVRLEEHTVVDTGFSTLEFSRDQGGFAAHTVYPNGFRKFRYHLKDERVSLDRYREAWRRSFELDMMNYPVITCVRNGRQIYLRDRTYHETTREGTRRQSIDYSELGKLVTRLGIHPQFARRALAALGKR